MNKLYWLNNNISVGKSNICVDISNSLEYNNYNSRHKNGGSFMNTLYERLREARKNLHLSQEYVSKIIGVTRTAIVEIESGKRKVSTDELAKFSSLYQISVDELMNGKSTEMPVQMFARSFGELDESDQKEILNLIEFKKRMKEHLI